MDFRNMLLSDFFETNGGKQICEQYAPELLKYPLKLFYKISCGEMFDLVVRKGLISQEKAEAIQAAVEAK